MDYKNYQPMDEETFVELLEMVTPLIEKRSSVLREPISAEQRLATLRFLVSSDSFEELKFQTAISFQTLGKIIAETCTALIHIFKYSVLWATRGSQTTHSSTWKFTESFIKLPYVLVGDSDFPLMDNLICLVEKKLA